MRKQLIYPTGSWVTLITPSMLRGIWISMGSKVWLISGFQMEPVGFYLLGSTGEPTSLSLEERKTIIEEMAPYCKGKIPVFFGSHLRFYGRYDQPCSICSGEGWRRDHGRCSSLRCSTSICGLRISEKHLSIP